MLIDILIEFRIFQYLFAKRRAFELRNGFVHRSILDPPWKESTPRMLHGGVRILIGGDFEPFTSRLLDLFDDLADPAPVALGAHLQMINMNRNAGIPSDTQGLSQFLHDIEALAAQVDAIIPAITPHDLGHLDNLVR